MISLLYFSTFLSAQAKDLDTRLGVGVNNWFASEPAIALRYALPLAKDNQEIDDEKVKLIKSKIRKNCSPKHVPAMIIKVPEIPRTKSGKIVELAVKQIINGEKINNKEAIANPKALKYFENLPQLD